MIFSFIVGDKTFYRTKLLSSSLGYRWGSVKEYPTYHTNIVLSIFKHGMIYAFIGTIRFSAAVKKYIATIIPETYSGIYSQSIGFCAGSYGLF